MKNTTAETILYYENFADSYVNETINCNFTDIEKSFVSMLNQEVMS